MWSGIIGRHQDVVCAGQTARRAAEAGAAEPANPRSTEIGFPRLAEYGGFCDTERGDRGGDKLEEALYHGDGEQQRWAQVTANGRGISGRSSACGARLRA